MTSLNPKQEAPRSPVVTPSPIPTLCTLSLSPQAAKLPGTVLSKKEGQGRPDESAQPLTRRLAQEAERGSALSHIPIQDR